MQKVVAVTIDIERLQEAGRQENPSATSFLSELPEINQPKLLYDMQEDATDSALQLEEEQEVE